MTSIKIGKLVCRSTTGATLSKLDVTYHADQSGFERLGFPRLY